MQRILLNVLQLTLLFGLTACVTTQTAPPIVAPETPQETASSSGESDPVVLARVGSEIVTVDEYMYEMKRRGGLQPGQFASVEQRRALLDEILIDKAAIVNARETRFDEDMETKKAVERLLIGLYLQAHLEPELEAVEISADEIRATYEAHRDEYMTPERRRVAWILLRVGSKAEAEQVEKVRQQAEEVREEAAGLPLETENLGALAQTHSNDAATRYVGGELGWIYLDQADGYRWGPELVQEAFALGGPGSLSKVLRHEKGFYMLKIVAVEEAAPTPLEKLQTGIRAKLLKERRDEVRAGFEENLLEGLSVEIDEKTLAAIEPLSGPVPAETAPPPMPGN